MNNILAITTKELFDSYFDKDLNQIDFTKDGFVMKCYFSFKLEKLIQMHDVKFKDEPLVIFQLDIEDSDIISIINGERPIYTCNVNFWIEITDIYNIHRKIESE